MGRVYGMRPFVTLLLFVCGLALSADEPVRIWTDLKGGKIKASFVRFQGDEIVIRRADGMLFQVHPSVFSAKDRKYLFELTTLFRSNEPVRFKDAKLEAAIRANLKKPEGPITKEAVLTCESLVLTSHRFEGIYGIPQTLMDLGQKGCPESLKFHRKYNHFSTWPPKYQLLLKYVKNH